MAPAIVSLAILRKPFSKLLRSAFCPLCFSMDSAISASRCSAASGYTGILKRAGSQDGGPVGARCEYCDAENYEVHPMTGSKVIITIAHLDHDPENWEVKDDRLAALCQKCHFGTHRGNRENIKTS